MDFKKINEFTITECMDLLQLELAVVKSIAQENNSQSAIQQDLSELFQEELSDFDKMVLSRLSEFLYNDKTLYSSCNNKSNFQDYLSAWPDGLWRKEAEEQIKKIDDRKIEEDFFKKNKNSIAGLKKYLSAYPKGSYADSAHQIINNKLKSRKQTTYIFLTLVLLTLAILCYTTYHPVSYLNPIDKITYDKWGGAVTRTLQTDALLDNVHFFPSEKWVKINKDTKAITIEAEPNPDPSRSCSISIYAYTTLLGFNLSRKETTIKVYQASGLANFFYVDNDSLLLGEEGSGNRYYVIKVNTDGTTWSVKKSPNWIKDTDVILATKDGEQGTLKFAVPRNTGKILTGTITIMANNGSMLDIYVKQWGDPTNLSASNNTLTFGTSYDYEYVDISNDSQKSLSTSISDDEDNWLSASVCNNSEIRITCNSNDNDPPRSGTVFVECGHERTSITVRQDGWITCDNCHGNKIIECNNSKAQWIYYPMTGDRRHQVNSPVQYMYMGQWFINYNNWIDCKNCGGNGQLTCSDCRGKGKVLKSNQSDY